MRKIHVGVVVVLFLLCVSPLYAQTDIPPFYQDPDPPSTAPGMTKCSTYIGCKQCVVVDSTNSQQCATVLESHGSCKCENVVGGCKTSGWCTYVGG